MSKMRISLASAIALALCLMMGCRAPDVEDTNGPVLLQEGTSDGVVITLIPYGAKFGKVYNTTKLLVLLSNRSGRAVYIDRHLSGYPAKRHNSLVVSVVDVESGRSPALRARFKPIERQYKPNDLIELSPDYSFGPTMDLRDWFQLKPGRQYRIVFTYKSLPPDRVGDVQPLKSAPESAPVTIQVPGP